jgi:hypothetical protein
LYQGKDGCIFPLKLIILSLKQHSKKGPFSAELKFTKTNLEVWFCCEMLL